MEFTGLLIISRGGFKPKVVWGFDMTVQISTIVLKHTQIVYFLAGLQADHI